MRLNSRLKVYCNQTAQLEKLVGVDDFGNPAYSDVEEIQVRKEGQYKLFRNVNGEAKTSTTRVFCAQKVNVNDKIDGRFVIDVLALTDKAGNVVGWEAYI